MSQASHNVLSWELGKCEKKTPLMNLMNNQLW